MRFKIAGAAVLLLAIALPIQAQQPPQPPRAPGAPAAPRAMRAIPIVELALRQKEQLKLTDAQANQLEAIRKEIVAEKQQRATQMIDVQSRLAAGLIKREDIRKQFETQRDAVQKTAEARRDRINKILTQDQQDQLRQHIRHLAMQRMRMNGMRGGRGMQGMRGGMQGRGMQGQRMMRPRRPFPPPGPGFEDEEQFDEDIQR